MLLLIAALLAAAVMSPWLLLRAGRRAFLAIALVPLAGTAWVAAQGAAVHDGETLVEVHPWVGSIGLDLALAMGTLQWVMSLIVLGIGALVLAYCAWYFDDDEPGVPRFAGVLVAFVASMLGLVLADDLLLLYVFWELTTVFSFLLIGHDSERRASRRAAIQALVVTTFGGLVLLVGTIVVGRAAGTFRITEILADPPTGRGRDRRRPAPPRGRRQQVGPAPLPLLAPVGHGGADPRQRLPARGVDGQGRRLPRRRSWLPPSPA